MLVEKKRARDWIFPSVKKDMPMNLKDIAKRIQFEVSQLSVVCDTKNKQPVRRSSSTRAKSTPITVRTDFTKMPMMNLSINGFIVLVSKVWTCLCFIFNRQVRAFVQYQPVKYDLFPLSPVSRHRLSMVHRKTLVLDLDETLIHSHHDAMPRNTVKPGTPHDFTVKVTIDRHPVRFFVHKRPHVDFFLDVVSQWYDLVVFTASMEIYGAAVADKLDNGRNILRRRYYRQHCTPDFGSYTKDLTAICNDLNRIFILDNSPGAYRCFPNNAIPIKSWFSDPMDICLLSLLPLLDALRFTNDVRSVLSRNLHLHRLW